jgi:hypothetical protein
MKILGPIGLLGHGRKKTECSVDIQKDASLIY